MNHRLCVISACYSDSNSLVLQGAHCPADDL